MNYGTNDYVWCDTTGSIHGCISSCRTLISTLLNGLKRSSFRFTMKLLIQNRHPSALRWFSIKKEFITRNNVAFKAIALSNFETPRCKFQLSNKHVVMINKVEYLLTLINNGLPVLSWSAMSPHIQPEPWAHLISSIRLFFLCQGVLLEHGQFPWKSSLLCPYLS